MPSGYRRGSEGLSRGRTSEGTLFWVLPVLDLDFSVEGDAVSLARRLAEQTGSSFSAHSRFGTATVLMGDIRLDLVTARGETYSQPGQLPEVRPSSIADDLARRDFAINAMALPVARDTARSGSLIDSHGRSGRP